MNKARVLIVDYGMGNIRSVRNALVRSGCDVTTSDRAEDIAACDALILPGVGAFSEAVNNIDARGLREPLLRAVRAQHKPLLGICLGMQLLAESSDEGGHSQGLALIPGHVRRIAVKDGLRLPHVGWNDVRIHRQAPLFSDMTSGDCFYFVHSYHFMADAEHIAATTDYGGDVVAAVQRDHVFGVQFHPERSQSKGLALLGNFVAHVNANLQR